MLDSIIGKTATSQQEDDSQWLSVSDLMAGLMMVFLFISIVLMRNALIERDNVKEIAETYQIERDKVKEIAAAYQDNKVKIYDALMSEFADDLSQWDAEINKIDLTFNFKSPEVLFDIGKISVKPTFQKILDDFFPRYLSVIKQFNSSIEEVRIEGHTSSRWGNGVSADDAYFKNMDLSQGRTRAVLSHIYNIEAIQNQRLWIKSNIAAVGYSSSKKIMVGNTEDVKRSRRVTFRLITNSETQILKIIEG